MGSNPTSGIVFWSVTLNSGVNFCIDVWWLLVNYCVVLVIRHDDVEFEAYLFILSGARESIDEKVELKPCEGYDLHTIKSPQDCQDVANSTESLAAIEECMTVWIKQIEQVRTTRD